MLCLCSCSSWGWACQGPKHVVDSSVTYMLLLKCALKLVEEIILFHRDSPSLSSHKQIIIFTSLYLTEECCNSVHLSTLTDWYDLPKLMRPNMGSKSSFPYERRRNQFNTTQTLWIIFVGESNNQLQCVANTAASNKINTNLLVRLLEA